MDAYLFQSELLCDWCAQEFMRETAKPEHVDMYDESSYDSDEWPKGPYGKGGGEADSPQHCGYCGLHLENALTDYGDEYVRNLAKPYETRLDMSWAEIAQAAQDDGQPVLSDWIIFYFAEGN